MLLHSAYIGYNQDPFNSRIQEDPNASVHPEDSEAFLRDNKLGPVHLSKLALIDLVLGNYGAKALSGCIASAVCCRLR